ncbi:MAG: nucleoside hydrolase [Rubrivivax sp.]|nr:nucleoside hydrolase [Rubrivivax sp.]
MPTRFPSLRDDELLARLAPPAHPTRPAVVIDTDAANEIDDPFAIAWALLATQRLRVLACFAAPFSFEYRRHEALRGRIARDTPGVATAEDHEFLRLHGHKLAFWEAQGWDPATLALPSFCTPEQGMRRSFDEIVNVYALLGQPPAGRAFAGSTRYLRSFDEPEPSAATARLIELAAAQPADEPLYVLAIGCLTNIANALLIEPELVRRLVVVWTAGYPSHAPHVNRAFNLEQDLLATQLVFDCGVPLVYLPGYHVGAQLRLSLPEMERHVRGCGAIGAHLHGLFTHNPLWPLVGIEGAQALAPSRACSWVIWDLINVAWMLAPESVPSELVRTPRIGADLRWHADAARPWMREAHAVQRDAIFSDFFACLGRAP